MYVYYRNVKLNIFWRRWYKIESINRPNDEATKLNQQQTRTHTHTRKSAECNDLEKQKWEIELEVTHYAKRRPKVKNY